MTWARYKFCGTYTCAYVIYEWYFRPPSQGCTRDDLPSISLKWILSVLSFLQFRKYAKTTSLSLICRSLIQSVISKLSISSCWASKNSKIALLFNFFPFWCRPNLNDCKESTVRKFSCFKVSFFGQCSKMQLIPTQNFIIKLVLSNFFGFSD